MIDKTAGDRLRYAKQFYGVLCTGQAAPLLELQPDKRIHAMKALASLARFTGSYDKWMQIRQRYNMKWSTGNEALTVFQRFFDDSKSLDTMIQWVKQAISVLPADMTEVIKFNCFTGLRPIEAINAIKLIKNPDTFKIYYNASNGTLEHFRFPQIFLRRTKVAYTSIVDKEQLSGIASMTGKIPSYTAIRYALTRKGIEMHMAYCRKIYASWLRQQGIKSEMVDLLQGRVWKSIFLRHYYRPGLEYRDRVLESINKLRRELLM